MSQFVIFITITLKSGMQDAFMPIILENAAASERDEAGCRQFDVWLPLDGTPDTVHLYEVYDDEDAFAAHQASSHYKKFDEVGKPMVDNMAVIRMKGPDNG